MRSDGPMEMGRRTRIAGHDEIPVGERKLVEVGGKEIALFHMKEGYFAIENSCPHRNGPLIRGKIDAGEVICPMHGWRFDLQSGACRLHSHVQAAVYPVCDEKEGLFLEGNNKEQGDGDGKNGSGSVPK